MAWVMQATARELREKGFRQLYNWASRNGFHQLMGMEVNNGGQQMDQGR